LRPIQPFLSSRSLGTRGSVRTNRIGADSRSILTGAAERVNRQISQKNQPRNRLLGSAQPCHRCTGVMADSLAPASSDALRRDRRKL
jgi:hypothetical protein